MASRFSVEAIFRAVDRVSAPVTRMQNRVGKMTRGMGRGFRRLNRSVDKFTDGIQKGALVVTAALALTTGAMANIISTGAEFEQTLVSAAAKFPGEIRKGTEAFQQLEQAARKTGATTEFTATQSAEALNFLAMAGFNAEQSISALPGVVDLATASGTDLATATDIATDALGAFGLMTKDTAQLQTNLARVGDVLLKTSVTANATVEQLFESMKKAAPIATAAGVSLETVASLMGTMANSGIKAEKSGTAVANMFLNLTAPSTRAQKILKKLRIELKNTDGSLRDVPTLIDDLNKSMGGLADPQKLAVLEQLFGREGLAGVATVVAGGGDALREYRKELEGATGSQKKMAEVMRDTLQGRLNSLKSAIEGVKLSIFDMSEGPLNDVVLRMTEWVRVNEDVIASELGGFLSMVFENFGEIASAIGDVAMGIGSIFALTVALKAVSAILGIINLLMMANPLVLGIMAAVLAVGLLIVALTPLGDMLSNIGSGISDAFSAIGRLGAIFGFGDDEEGKKPIPAQVVSPQERVARSIEETRSTSTSEVTIKDETGRAEVTNGKLATGIKLQSTGGF